MGYKGSILEVEPAWALPLKSGSLKKVCKVDHFTSGLSFKTLAQLIIKKSELEVFS